MLEEAKKFFSEFVGDKDKITNVWYEPKMDTYYCRTDLGQYWQIRALELNKEVARRKSEGKW